MLVDFEKLRMAGAGKAIAVLTSGGDAQGNLNQAGTALSPSSASLSTLLLCLANPPPQSAYDSNLLFWALVLAEGGTFRQMGTGSGWILNKQSELNWEFLN